MQSNVALPTPNLDDLQHDAQNVVCDHLTCYEVDATHDVDALPDDLPDVHLDVVNDVLAGFSKMSLWMLYVNSSMLNALLYLSFLMLSSMFYLFFLMMLEEDFDNIEAYHSRIIIQQQEEEWLLLESAHLKHEHQELEEQLAEVHLQHLHRQTAESSTSTALIQHRDQWGQPIEIYHNIAIKQLDQMSLNNIKRFKQIILFSSSLFGRWPTGNDDTEDHKLDDLEVCHVLVPLPARWLVLGEDDLDEENCDE